MNILNKISALGIQEEMPVFKQKRTIFFNIVIRISAIALLFIAALFYFVFDLFYIPVGFLFALPLIAVSLYLNYKGKVEISAFIIAIFFPVYFVFLSVYAKIHSEGLSAPFFLFPRMGLIIMSVIAFSVLGFKADIKAFLGAVVGFICFIFYNKIHAFFGIDTENIVFTANDFKFAIVIMGILFAFFLMIVFILQKIIVQYEQIIITQRNELSESNAEISAQNDELETQGNKILKQNEQISDSIRYASRIQNAAIPDDGLNSEKLDYFIMFRPRDIVSGDFYWIKSTIKQGGKQNIIIAADCTGHGVPGAFVSMLGISFINEIVAAVETLEPDIILNSLREKIKFSLYHTGEQTQAKDGMDMAVCIIDEQSLEMKYAGAHNPLYFIRKGEIIRYKADRMPVGAHKIEHNFKIQTIQLQAGDNFYIFSDGYTDQFGGENGGKFKSNRFKALLSDISTLPVKTQKKQAEETFDKWRQNREQLDDVLLIGVGVK